MKAEQHLRLSLVGPQTDAGGLLRHGWQPVALLDDLQAADVPVSIVHGWHDELIPAQAVVDWSAARNATLLLVDDEHRLSAHVQASADAFAALLARL